MSRETLLAELNRLLDAGQLLLTTFPKKNQGSSVLQLPDSISPEMRWYADDVASRAEDRYRYRAHLQSKTTDSLAGWVTDCEVGLLGWRAIGVLK